MLDAAALGEEPGERAHALFRAGVDWIQLRERQLSGAGLHRLAAALVGARERASEGGGMEGRTPRVIVNRRLDVALAAGADGVHLGFDAVAPGEARQLLGPEALIGASLHGLDELERPSRNALSYAHLAPIWSPLSKPATRPPLGLERLAQGCRLGLPLLAQGGIDPQRAARAVAAGAAGIAVTGSLTRRRQPAVAVAELREALDAVCPMADAS